MFGIGFGELVVIAFLAVLVFGPDKLPELARQAGAMIRKLRRFAISARDELREELGPEYADLDLRDLDPRQIVRRHIEEAIADLDEEELGSRNGHALPDPGQRPLDAGERPPYDLEAT